MTTWYFDSDLGSDGNPGKSQDKPKQSYDTFANSGFPGAAQGDIYLFKRGKQQVASSANVAVGSGASTTNRTKWGVYGDSQVPYAIWTPPPSGPMNNPYILNMSGRNYVDMEDQYFDALNRATYTLYLFASGATSNSGHAFRRCFFMNAAPGVGGTGLHFGGTDTSTGDTSDYLFEDCGYGNNPVHGMLIAGAHGVTVRRCKFWGNGFNAPAGGHGLSSKYRLQEFTTSGWTQSGLVWYRALASYQTDVYYVITGVNGYGRLTKNIITPTTPAAGEFGVSGGNLYINVNSINDPKTQNVRYAWGRCYNLLIEDNESWENVNDPASPYVEGHGFAFDNWSDDSVMRGNKAWRNGGAGFSCNLGDRNVIESNIAYENQASGIVMASAQGILVYHNTLLNNNLGPVGIRNNGEITAFPNCKNGEITNNILKGSGQYGVDLFPDVTGFTGDKNCIHGFDNVERVGILANTLVTDPLLDSNFRPRALALTRSGKYIGRKDFNGKRFYNPPNIGAVDDVTATPRYLMTCNG